MQREAGFEYAHSDRLADNAEADDANLESH
jgi:hypothetical protein